MFTPPTEITSGMPPGKEKCPLPAEKQTTMPLATASRIASCSGFSQFGICEPGLSTLKPQLLVMTCGRMATAVLKASVGLPIFTPMKLIPGAVAALETTLADFSVGKAEFSTLYEAEVELLSLERSYFAATIETHVQRAAARGLTGAVELGGSS